MVTYSKAAIALHNYLRTTESSAYCPPGFVDGEDGTGNVICGTWRTDQDPCSGLEPLQHAGSNRFVHTVLLIIHVYYHVLNRYSRSAALVRDSYRDYFNSSVGDVSWQYVNVRRT